jgi:hypothetical protein
MKDTCGVRTGWKYGVAASGAPGLSAGRDGTGRTFDPPAPSTVRRLLVSGVHDIDGELGLLPVTGSAALAEDGGIGQGM